MDEVSDALDELQPDAAHLDAQAARLVATARDNQLAVHASSSSHALANRPWYHTTGARLVAAAAVLVSALGAWWLWHTPAPLSPAPLDPEPIACRTANGERIVEDDWVRAEPRASTELQFSDGSRVELLPDARLSVDTLGSDEVVTRLESGALHVAIVPKGPRAWVFDVGPLSVSVLGTAFDLEWSPQRGEMRLRVESGLVAVEGAQIQGGRVEVSAGHSLLVDTSRPATLRLGATPSEALNAPPQPPAEERGAQEEAPPQREEAMSDDTARAQPRERRLKARAALTPSWRELARAGDYDVAWESVAQTGYAIVRDDAATQDLILLADVARYSGHLPEAIDTLEWIYEVHPKQEIAAEAVFRLGRIEFDQRHRYESAARWFSLYTSEYPSGRWAEKALGLTLRAHIEADQIDRAHPVAERYLERYPHGAYAPLARDVSERAD